MGLTRINFGQISSANVDAKFEDPTLLLNHGQTGGNTKDAGIIIERGSDSNVGFIWDESEGTFALINTSGNGTIRGNVTVSSYADLIANNVVVDGNLTVNGTTTTLNTSTLDVEDINLTIAKGASNSEAADGAGITIEGADATILWSDTAGKLVFNKSITLGSNTITANAVVGDGSGLTGLQSIYYTASATPPGSAKAGDIWLDTDTGIKYTYFTDEDTSQWVEFDALNAFGNYAIEGGGGGGGSGLTAWSVENSAVTAASGDRILVDVSSAAVTVTLPSSPSVGDEVRIVDAEGNAGTNNITVARNGSKITGLDENLVIDVDNGSVELVYYSVSRGWIIV